MQNEQNTITNVPVLTLDSDAILETVSYTHLTLPTILLV